MMMSKTRDAMLWDFALKTTKHIYKGMAPNPIVLNKAKALFPHLDFGFLPWFVGAIVPAAVCAVGLPLILRWACGLGGNNQMQDHKSSSSNNDNSVVKHAQTELDQMGSVTSKEWVSNN